MTLCIECIDQGLDGYQAILIDQLGPQWGHGWILIGGISLRHSLDDFPIEALVPRSSKCLNV